MKGAFVAVAAGALVVVGASAFAGCSQVNQQTQTCRIDDKDRSTNGDGASVYRVYTDCGIFEVRDTLLEGNFNSADMFAKLNVGDTYQIKSGGIRNGVLSSFPNILEAKKV